jgi:hypothetical protein
MFDPYMEILGEDLKEAMGAAVLMLNHDSLQLWLIN